MEEDSITAPTTPPAAPYNSFSVEIGPLANSSFFSHRTDETLDSDPNQEDGVDDDDDDDDDDEFQIQRQRRRRRSSSSVTPRYSGQFSNDGEEEEDDLSEDMEEFLNPNSTTEISANRSQDNDDNDNNDNNDEGGEEEDRNSEGEEEEEEDGNPPEEHNDESALPILQATSQLYIQNSPYLREIGGPPPPSYPSNNLTPNYTTFPPSNPPSHSSSSSGGGVIWSLSSAKPGNGVEQLRDNSSDTYWQSDGGQPHLCNIQFLQRKAISCICVYLDYNLDESYTPKQLSIRTGMTFHDLEEVQLVELFEPVGWICIPLKGALDPLDDDEEEDDDDHGDELKEHTSKEEDEMFSTSQYDIPVEDEPIVQTLKSQLVQSWKHPTKTHFVQICIVSMHQNGRDTHIRQMKLFGPKKDLDPYSSHSFYHRHPIKPLSKQNEEEQEDEEFHGWDSGFRHKFQTVAMTQFNTIR